MKAEYKRQNTFHAKGAKVEYKERKEYMFILLAENPMVVDSAVELSVLSSQPLPSPRRGNQGKMQPNVLSEL